VGIVHVGACPAPVSFAEATPTLEICADDAIDKLSDTRTVYEPMRTSVLDSSSGCSSRRRFTDALLY
jgi:hypothetical protein